MDGYGDSDILDIVRGLREVDIDISAPARDTEDQGSEIVQLGNDF